MKFDLFYELSTPSFGGRDESQVFAETLEELAWAEQCGFETAWFVEHHFMREYSHSSAPSLFLAAASQRTSKLRLGHGIVPLPYHHPVQVAEQLATLDILCQGRLEFGFGRGFSPLEYQTFGAAMSESRSRTEESLAILRQFFSRQPIHFHGQHYQLDGLDIVPHPVQHPHPPLWTAAVSPDSFTMAAQQGIGVLAGPFKPWFMIKEDIKRYRKAWREHHGDGPALPGQNPRVGMTLGIFCLEDHKQARDLARPALLWFYNELLKQTRPVLENLYQSYEYYRRIGHLSPLFAPAANLRILETMGLVIAGDPTHCRRKLQALHKAGVDHVLCAFGAGVLDSAITRQSMQVFAEQVAPHFAEPARCAS